MLPNTTQIPNILFNGEMQKMRDTELRIVLIVARKTLGWILNEKTSMRKEEDWISHHQLMEFTGRKSRALSTAIDNCIKKGWIEARSEKGQLLDTKEKRIGKKIYYRLGRIFLSKIEEPPETSAKRKEVLETPAKSAIAERKDYKRNYITKYSPSKEGGENPPPFGNPDINFLISFLKEKMQLKKLDGSEKENRRYCWLSIRKFGKRETVCKLIEIATKSSFHSQNLTSFKYLFSHGVKIANELRKRIDNIAII